MCLSRDEREDGGQEVNSMICWLGMQLTLTNPISLVVHSLPFL